MHHIGAYQCLRYLEGLSVLAMWDSIHKTTQRLRDRQNDILIRSSALGDGVQRLPYLYHPQADQPGAAPQCWT